MKKKKEYVYIVIEIGGEVPVIRGVFKTEKSAWDCIVDGHFTHWCNVVKQEVKE